MRVLGDSNLVVSQAKGDFALREQSLAVYRTWAQRLEQEFQTFSIEYTQRSENRFVDALATLKSQVPFKRRDMLVKIGKQEHSIIRILQEMYPGKSKQQDWRSEVKEKMKKAGPGGNIKELKDYTLIEGELYRRLPGGILSKCINEKEGKLRLEELHTQACGIVENISLYRRMQRMGYYQSNMNKEVVTIQEKCQECWLAIDKEESYVVFVVKDQRISYLGLRDPTN